MRLTVRLDARQARRWHVDLLRRLAACPGLDVEVDPAPGPLTLPAAASLLFELERLLHGLPRSGPATPVPRSALDPFVPSVPRPADLVLDLCGGDSPARGERVWTLTFDGVPGEAALLDALLDGRTPTAAVLEGGTAVASGRLGTEYGGIALASFADTLARAVTLIVAALSGAASASLPPLPPAKTPAAPVSRLSGRGLAQRAVKQAASRAVQQLYHLACHAPHWRTGWRRLEGADVIDLRRHPDGGWRDLPDDGRRFYADPFPIAHAGQVTLFVEDFPHRLGKGLISAVAFGPDGPSGVPQPVLEQPGHLSYPFVFERDGQVWMIPESGGAGTVDLFRATTFPDGWVKEATLLSGLTASDATLVQDDGRWWMFATVREGGGAFSDALHLWSAPDFRGPWRPHHRNPVLIDIASARPAGRMVRRAGALLRPVQDCRRGYGAALGIARVLRLDDEAFEQEVETILTPGPLWRGRKLHTLNSTAGLEFIDGSGFAPRWGRGRAVLATTDNVAKLE